MNKEGINIGETYPPTPAKTRLVSSGDSVVARNTQPANNTDSFKRQMLHKLDKKLPEGLGGAQMLLTKGH